MEVERKKSVLDGNGSTGNIDISKVLWESSTKIIVESTDKFLKSITAKDFYNADLIKIIQNAQKGLKPVGEPSAQGKTFIYTDNLGNTYALKEQTLCPDNIGEMYDFLQNICKKAKLEHDTIFKIKSSYDKKYIVLAPNYIIENIVATLCSQLFIYSPSFAYIYGSQYDMLDPRKRYTPLWNPWRS